MFVTAANSLAGCLLVVCCECAEWMVLMMLLVLLGSFNFWYYNGEGFHRFNFSHSVCCCSHVFQQA